MSRPDPSTLLVSAVVVGVILSSACTTTIDAPPNPAVGQGATSSAGSSGAGSAGKGAGGSAGGTGGDDGGGGSSGSAGSSGSSGSGGGDSGLPARTGYSRLTRAEYRETITEALGVEPDLSLVPEDGRAGPFTSNATVSPDPVHPYLLTGEDLAVLAVPGTLPACGGASVRTCVEEEYGGPLGRLFRRPLSELELDGFSGLIGELEAAGVSPENATRAMLAGALLSPDFVFRSSPVSGEPARARALAEHLSYALWDAPPDAALREVPERPASELSTLLGVEARRLASDARAVPVVARFVAQWLHVDTDLRMADADFASSASYLELTALVEDVLANDAPVSSLLSATRGFVHPDNREAYGLAASSANGVEAVSWSGDSARRGVLAQELFADATRHPDPGRRPIFRGKLVRTSLLCDSIPPPSADLLALDGEVDDRTVDARCAGCHLLLDPIGRVFASLDLDHSGAVPAAEVTEHPELDGIYEDLPALLAAVSESRAFAECFARHFLGFFLEQSPADADASFVAELADQVQAGASLTDVIAETITSLEQRSRTLTPWCEGP